MSPEKALYYQMSLKKVFKELVLVLTTFMVVTATKKKVFGDAKTGEIGENGENSKNGNEDLINLV